MYRPTVALMGLVVIGFRDLEVAFCILLGCVAV